MTFLRVAVTVLVLALLVWLALYAIDWIAIDDCLDRGGRWDYDWDTCLGASR